MIKPPIYLIALISFFVACNFDFQKQTIYYFGDSHFSRMDENWWFPQTTNYNFAIPGTTLNEIEPQYHAITDTTALCFIQIGTNSIKGVKLEDVDTHILMDSVIFYYSEIMHDFSHKFGYTYILSVIPVSQNYNNGKVKGLGQFYASVNMQIDSISQTIKNVEYLNINPLLTNTTTLLLDNNVTIDYLHLNNFGYQLMTGVMRTKINKYED